MKRIVIIGGGAAGMIAAIAAADNGNEVFLIEKNEKLGTKIYITGKGRCNLTNYCDINEFMQNVVRNNKFIFASLNSLSPYDTYSFFENCGVKLKVERGNRVFPESDKASDVTKFLEKRIIEKNVKIRLNEVVKSLNISDGKICSVVTDIDEIFCDSVVVCTGGISYSSTGSTGDGYGFAKKIGHTIVDLVPSLVGVELKGGDYAELQGLSLKNVKIFCDVCGKRVFDDFGELLFTHYGISGPIVLSCSSIINRLDLNGATLSIDLKPALDYKTLDNRLIRELSANNKKGITNVIKELVPKSLIGLILSKAGIRVDKKCCEITKAERQKIIHILKCLSFEIKKLRPIEEAIVTSGGVKVSEINPKTLESKLVKGIFFAGEVLDVDAFTGGFNLQVAFSTGYLAGKNA